MKISTEVNSFDHAKPSENKRFYQEFTAALEEEVREKNIENIEVLTGGITRKIAVENERINVLDSKRTAWFPISQEN